MADEYVLTSSVLSSIHRGDIDMGMVTPHEYRLLKDLSERIDRRIQGVPAADVTPAVRRDAVMQALNKYFSIGDSYTFELVRVKEAFHVGTITLDDFEEWNEDNVSDLCDYLMKELFCSNCGAEMDKEG